jgi:hypothetical protein
MVSISTLILEYIYSLSFLSYLLLKANKRSELDLLTPVLRDRR